MEPKPNQTCDRTEPKTRVLREDVWERLRKRAERGDCKLHSGIRTASWLDALDE
jgi:hypothetical protein